MPRPGDSEAVEIVELTPDDERLGEALGVMRDLRTTRSDEELRSLYAEGHAGGYRIAGLFADGECRAAAGYRVLTTFAHGRFLYIDDLVTAERWRSHGYGERLEAYLVGVASAAGCNQVRLDSGVQRRRAHRFYFRRGYSIESFNFGRPLEGGS